MKTFELTLEERKRICESLDYDLSSIDFRIANGKTILDYPEQEERFYQLQALLAKLKPTPVQKEGWMVVWDGTTKYCKTSVIEDKQEADRLLGAMGGYPNVRIVRVTWEEK